MNGINVNVADSHRFGDIPEIGIQFLNGEVVIPNKPGGYVVASGCGSGKTTAIKELILKVYRSGVVYSAATIRECNEMYEFLLNNGIDENRVVILHSNTQDKGVDLNMLRNHPEQLADKWVIICTHHKLLNEYPELLLKYNCNVYSKSRMSHLSRAHYQWDADGKCRFPRMYVLVDEMPTCQSFEFNLSIQSLGLLGVAEQTTMYDENGNAYITDKLPLKLTNGNNYSVTENRRKAYNVPLVGNDDTESNRLKNDLALSIIFENYDRFNSMFENNRDLRSIKINYTLADQIEVMPKSSATRYIIFDGTGDLTFIPKDEYRDLFTVLSYSNKYNSPIGMHKVEMGYKRSFRTERDFRNYYGRLVSNIDIQINNISDIINSSHKVLVITWKNLKVGRDQIHGVPISEFDSREIEYIEYIKSGLNSLGHIEGVNYNIIHYQSGLDKAVNDYRDFDTVYFLGEFHVPNNVIDQFNQDYRVNTNVLNYTLYQLVQAVCRTRIRKHDMSPIDVYFTSDWDDKTMMALGDYIKSNNISEVRDTTLNHIKPKWRPVVELFSSLSPEFKDAIEIEGKTCRIEFTLDEIWDLTREVLPMKAKEVKSYYPLINYLRKFGIEVEIKGGAKNQYTASKS